MELDVQSPVERRDDKTAASSPPAPSPPATDPLANASCLHCGYSLRGLTENRCPECGTTFDSQEMAGSYLPEWPRLMVWYLTAACAASSFDLISLVLEALSAKRPVLLHVMAGSPQNSLSLFESATTILIAPFAIIGLIRRLDWGRKVTIGLCLVQIVPLLPASFFAIRYLVSAGRDNGLSLEMIWYVLPHWRLASQVSLPSLILACVFWTGLRRRSLRRSAVDAPLMLPRKVFSPRNDWLLMLVALLAVWAMVIFSYLAETALWLIWRLTSRSGFDASWWERLGSTASWTLLLAVQLGWLARIARGIWRDPASTRRRLKSLLIMVIAAFIAGQIINLLFSTEMYFFSSLETAVYGISGIVADALACLPIPLALYLYASRALPADAIARVTRPQEQSTTPIRHPLAES